MKERWAIRMGWLVAPAILLSAWSPVAAGQPEKAGKSGPASQPGPGQVAAADEMGGWDIERCQKELAKAQQRIAGISQKELDSVRKDMDKKTSDLMQGEEFKQLQAEIDNLWRQLETKQREIDRRLSETPGVKVVSLRSRELSDEWYKLIVLEDRIQNRMRTLGAIERERSKMKEAEKSGVGAKPEAGAGGKR